MLSLPRSTRLLMLAGITVLAVVAAACPNDNEDQDDNEKGTLIPHTWPCHNGKEATIFSNYIVFATRQLDYH